MAPLAQAVPGFLSTWQQLYPNSSSDDRSCQLCHVQADGGEPWNAYGFEIRDAYLNLFSSTDIQAAIEFVESNNSDSDDQGLTNRQEIDLNMDPGWAPGPVNFWIYKNGDAIGGNQPPFPELRPDQEICFTIRSRAGTPGIICL